MNFKWTGSMMCPLCGCFPFDSTQNSMCPRCVQELDAMPGPFLIPLPTCETPCYAAVEYSGIAKKTIEVIKLTGNRRLATDIGRLLLRPISAFLCADIESSVFVVPVPASKSGKRRRGFDQSLLIAGGVALSVTQPLMRKAGIQQKRLSRTGRFANAAEEYVLTRHAADRENVKVTQSVILIDDVLTTGASVSRCVALLSSEGFQVVGVAVCMVKR